MVTITIATLKGGQSKTFISALLCRELASGNNKVLAVSLCSQNDINFYLQGTVGKYQLYNAFENNDIKPAIMQTNFSNIDLVPYDIDSSLPVDRLLQTMPGSESRLKSLLHQVKDKYNYVVLDTGPNLGISTIAAFIASDFLVSPMLMQLPSLNGYIATLNALNEMKSLDLTKCKHLGIIRSRTNINRDTETFEVEDILTKKKYPELGTLPSSSALKTALLKQTNYDKVRSDHMSVVNALLTNILTKISWHKKTQVI